MHITAASVFALFVMRVAGLMGDALCCFVERLCIVNGFARLEKFPQAEVGGQVFGADGKDPCMC